MRRYAPLALSLLVSGLVIPSTGNSEWVNSKVNEDNTNQLQNEQQIVVNPQNPNNLVAVWRDFRLGYRQVGYGYSMDGGLTWNNPGLFVDPHYPRDSDPALTVNSDGDFFAMLLGYTGSTSEENGMVTYRSTDGGQNWEIMGFAVNQVPNVFEDKELIACDRTMGPRRGNLYMAWTRFYEVNIYVVASSDDGANWTQEVRVSDQPSVQFPTPAVGPDGTLYVAWTAFHNSSLLIDKSTDGGLSFGNDRQITNVANPHPTLNGGIGAPAHPAMDVDISGGPRVGRIYVAYLNRVSSSDYDIYVRWSDDQAVSWSSAVRINDDAFDNGRDQFHPWLTVDNTGVVSVVWLDRRHDPSNLSWHCYVSQSFDGGSTWTANQQVSTLSSRTGEPGGEIDHEADRVAAMENGPEAPGWLRRADAVTAAPVATAGANSNFVPGVDQDQDESLAGFIGEYIGIAAWDGYASVIWTDMRNGNQDAYAAAEDLGVSVGENEGAISPRVQVAPNPSSGPMSLRYEVPADGWVNLEVFDVQGKLVRTLVDRKLRRGSQRFTWDGTNQAGDRVAPGSYYIRYRAPGIEESAAVRLRP